MAEEWTHKRVQAQLALPGPWQVSVGGVPGLCLRRNVSAALWTLRGRIAGDGRQRSWTVGDGKLDLFSARSLAGVAYDMARRGEDPAEFLAERVEALREPGVYQQRKMPAKAVTWTWDHAVGMYLKHHVAVKLRPATQDDYRKTLAHPDVKALAREVGDIDSDAMNAMQNRFTDRHKYRAARHAVVVVRACLEWVSGRPESGFKRDRWRVVTDIKLATPPKKTEAQRQARVPTHPELGKVLWRLNDTKMTPGLRLGLALLCLTGQRIASLRGAEAGHLVGSTWQIPEHLMKGGASHWVPLPPVALGCMQALVAMVGGTGLLFPQLRLRRAGDEGGAPMAYSAFRRPLVAALGHAPHAARRAVGTHGEGEGLMSVNEIARVLDHRERAESAITREAYALAAHPHQAGMLATLAAWEAFMLRLMREHAPPGLEWPAFLPRPPALATP